MNRHERRRQGKLSVSFTPYADPIKIFAVRGDFEAGTIRPIDLAVLTTSSGLPLQPIVSIDTSNRRDISDLLRVHFQETGGAGLDVKTTWAFLAEPQGLSFARLEIEVFRPVKTNFKILFELDKLTHRKFLRAIATCLIPGITIDFKDQPVEKSFLGFEIETASLQTFFTKYVRPEAA